jgi:hypothetical protein
MESLASEISYSSVCMVRSLVWLLVKNLHEQFYILP